MSKLKPEVREAVSALEEIFNPEGMQGESNWQIVRDELRCLTERAEKAEAERDALRISMAEYADLLEGFKPQGQYPGPLYVAGMTFAYTDAAEGLRKRLERAAIDKVRIVPEQEETK